MVFWCDNDKMSLRFSADENYDPQLLSKRAGEEVEDCQVAPESKHYLRPADHRMIRRRDTLIWFEWEWWWYDRRGMLGYHPQVQQRRARREPGTDPLNRRWEVSTQCKSSLAPSSSKTEEKASGRNAVNGRYPKCVSNEEMVCFQSIFALTLMLILFVFRGNPWQQRHQFSRSSFSPPCYLEQIPIHVSE